MDIGIPQIIYLVLLVLGLGVSLAKDGERKVGRWSFWSDLVGAALSFAFLWWGGFFS